ncbi:unnamed protein product [Cylicostephanus goldi]|uniref:Uncharacterized protein n=1 Tax=Cylicostephanus goldi TaxID=71465 RepID=A0A3P7NXZ3_CYLGO|nr:unnamed protein product [Cylicostephanus goldi]
MFYVTAEWMLSVSEIVDDRRPIRKELNRPDDLHNMHNKWTFPTALLYVLTVLTTCVEKIITAWRSLEKDLN